MDAKSQLNQFCQRLCQKPVRKEDIIYEVLNTASGLQATVTLHCLGGAIYAGEPSTNEKDAQQSAASKALEDYAEEMSNLSPAVKKGLGVTGMCGKGCMGGGPYGCKANSFMTGKGKEYGKTGSFMMSKGKAMGKWGDQSASWGDQSAGWGDQSASWADSSDGYNDWGCGGGGGGFNPWAKAGLCGYQQGKGSFTMNKPKGTGVVVGSAAGSSGVVVGKGKAQSAWQQPAPTTATPEIVLPKQVQEAKGILPAHDWVSELNACCQRYLQRPTAKGDIEYTVERCVEGFQATVTLHCFDGEPSFAGEVVSYKTPGNQGSQEKQAKQFAAKQVMDAYKEIFATTPAKAAANKKKKLPTQQVIAPTAALLIAGSSMEDNDSNSSKGALTAMCMKLAKRMVQKGEIVYETSPIDTGGHQSQVTLNCLPDPWAGQAWIGEVMSDKKLAEQSAADMALTTLREHFGAEA